ncbi:MAG: glycosyltransferase [Oligoflexia bacterium]|nr:glycosyltransferase [Oligoflexia bacterium]
MQKQLTILIPVYNDSASLQLLLRDINHCFKNEDLTLSILLVDDGSDLPLKKSQFEENQKIQILRLHQNLGHQNALAKGLQEWTRVTSDNYILIMDADGEDSASDALRLWKSVFKENSLATVAKRKKRNEKFITRILIKAYHLIFRMLTGKNLDFGNFSLLKRELVLHILRKPKNFHLASSILANIENIHRITCDKSQRFFGESKMSLSKNLSLAWQSLLPFKEQIIQRILVLGILLSILSNKILFCFLLAVFSFLLLLRKSLIRSNSDQTDFSGLAKYKF